MPSHLISTSHDNQRGRSKSLKMRTRRASTARMKPLCFPHTYLNDGSKPPNRIVPLCAEYLEKFGLVEESFCFSTGGSGSGQDDRDHQEQLPDEVEVHVTGARLVVDPDALIEFVREVDIRDLCDVNCSKTSPASGAVSLLDEHAAAKPSAPALTEMGETVTGTKEPGVPVTDRVENELVEDPEQTMTTRLNDIARILAYNVVNFSFWPDGGSGRWWIDGKDDASPAIGKDDEALAIVECLRRWEKTVGTRSIDHDDVETSSLGNIWRDAAYLTGLTREEVGKIFAPGAGAGELPLLDWRLQCLHSLGACYERTPLEKLLELMEVSDARMTLESAGDQLKRRKLQDAENNGVTSDSTTSAEVTSGRDTQKRKTTTTVARFVSVLCTHIPAFRDVRGHIEFAKRPQLSAAMLHADGLVDFLDIKESITVFSDYRLPQILAAKGVLTLKPVSPRAPDAADGTSNIRSACMTLPELFRLSEKSPLRQGAEDDEVLASTEMKIRAGTIVAADLLFRKLKELYPTEPELTVGNLDYYLWRKAVELESPFPHCRTHCY